MGVITKKGHFHDDDQNTGGPGNRLKGVCKIICYLEL